MTNVDPSLPAFLADGQAASASPAQPSPPARPEAPVVAAQPAPVTSATLMDALDAMGGMFADQPSAVPNSNPQPEPIPQPAHTAQIAVDVPVAPAPQPIMHAAQSPASAQPAAAMQPTTNVQPAQPQIPLQPSLQPAATRQTGAGTAPQTPPAQPAMPPPAQVHVQQTQAPSSVPVMTPQPSSAPGAAMTAEPAMTPASATTPEPTVNQLAEKADSHLAGLTAVQAASASHPVPNNPSPQVPHQQMTAPSQVGQIASEAPSPRSDQTAVLASVPAQTAPCAPETPAPPVAPAQPLVQPIQVATSPNAQAMPQVQQASSPRHEPYEPAEEIVATSEPVIDPTSTPLQIQTPLRTQPTQPELGLVPEKPVAPKGPIEPPFDFAALAGQIHAEAQEPVLAPIESQSGAGDVSVQKLQTAGLQSPNSPEQLETQSRERAASPVSEPAENRPKPAQDDAPAPVLQVLAALQTSEPEAEPNDPVVVSDRQSDFPTLAPDVHVPTHPLGGAEAPVGAEAPAFEPATDVKPEAHTDAPEQPAGSNLPENDEFVSGVEPPLEVSSPLQHAGEVVSDAVDGPAPQPEPPLQNSSVEDPFHTQVSGIPPLLPPVLEEELQPGPALPLPLPLQVVPSQQSLSHPSEQEPAFDIDAFIKAFEQPSGIQEPNDAVEPFPGVATLGEKAPPQAPVPESVIEASIRALTRSLSPEQSQTIAEFEQSNPVVREPGSHPTLLDAPAPIHSGQAPPVEPAVPVSTHLPQAEVPMAATPASTVPTLLPQSSDIPPAAPEYEPAAPSVSPFSQSGATPGVVEQQPPVAPQPAVVEPQPPITPQVQPSPAEAEKARRSAQIVRELLDLMASPPGKVQPQERALAADTLLRMLEKIPTQSKIELAERISIMEDPPAMIVSQLVLDDNLEIAGPLIQKGTVVSDQDLLAIIETANVDKCNMVARRRIVPNGVASALIDTNMASVMLTLVRNPEATLSPDVLQRLTDLARTQPSLQAPLVTRADMMPQIAFDLFWALPTELRRYVFSRFLTDSSMLERILRVTIAAEDGDFDGSVMEGQNYPADEQTAHAASLIEQGLIKDATQTLSQLAKVSESSAHRIIADPSGEPLTIIFKAMGISRADFAVAVERWRASPTCILRNDRDVEELKTLFDLLSYNKARVVLTYWDWLSRKAKPAVSQVSTAVH